MSELSINLMNQDNSVLSFFELQTNAEGIHSRGRQHIASTNWQKVLGLDLQHYTEVSFDPDCTVAQREAFCKGIVHGYELMLGLFSHSPLSSIDPSSLTREDVSLFSEVLQGKFTLPEGFMRENGFETDDSSEYFFVLLADKLSEDEHFSTLIESCAELLQRPSQSGNENCEYIIAGFFHGIASVYGIEKLRHERDEHYAAYNIEQGVGDLSRFLEDNDQ